MYPFRFRLSLHGLCAVLLVTAGTAVDAAEIRRGEDYVAVIIEAEDFDEKSDRWVLTEPGTPEQQPDPDGNHSDGASGSAYLELLPDTRVTEHDPFIGDPNNPNANFWGTPGTGPIARYSVDIPEPGRYHVHVRAYSTGKEDNGLHIGIDGQWPTSGAALQVCRNASIPWRWSSKKRDSGGLSCGVLNTIWLDVETAGDHVVMISPREDGFEIDRMMLIKDLSENTRHCLPATHQADQIDCKDGGIDQADEFVDMALAIDAPEAVVKVGDAVAFEIEIRNDDKFDFAHDIVLELDFADTDWMVADVDSRCETVESGLRCELGQMGPTGAHEVEVVAVTLEPQIDAQLELEARVMATETDDDPENDSVTVRVDVEDDSVPTQVLARFEGLPVIADPGIPTALDIILVNDGEGPARDARLTLVLPDALEVEMLPRDCSGTRNRIDCELGDVADGESERFSLNVMGEESGIYAVVLEASADNADARSTVASFQVSDPDTGGDGGSDSGGETGGDEGGVNGSGDGGGDTGGEATAGDEGDDGDGEADAADDDAGALGGFGLCALVLAYGMRRRWRRLA